MRQRFLEPPRRQEQGESQYVPRSVRSAIPRVPPSAGPQAPPGAWTPLARASRHQLSAPRPTELEGASWVSEHYSSIL